MRQGRHRLLEDGARGVKRDEGDVLPPKSFPPRPPGRQAPVHVHVTQPRHVQRAQHAQEVQKGEGAAAPRAVAVQPRQVASARDGGPVGLPHSQHLRGGVADFTQQGIDIML